MELSDKGKIYNILLNEAVANSNEKLFGDIENIMAEKEKIEDKSLIYLLYKVAESKPEKERDQFLLEVKSQLFGGKKQ